MENKETVQKESYNFFNAVEDLLVLKNSQSGFKIYYQNCNGLRTKLYEFRDNLGKENYDAIVLTETNLQPKNEYSTLLESKGYMVFEKHRSPETSSKKSGGGVLVAVLNVYNPERRPKWEGPDLESVAVHLKIITGNKLKYLNLFGTYIPPSSNLSVYENHFLNVFAAYSACNLVGISPQQQFCLIGDYNIPDIRWQPTYLPEYSEDYVAITSKVFGYSKMMDLIQYNRIFNKNDRILDLVLSNKRCFVRKAPIPLVKEDTHHPALIINIPNDDEGEEKDVYDEELYTQIRLISKAILWHKLFLMNSKEIARFIKEYMEKLLTVLRRNQQQNLNTATEQIVKRFETYLSNVKIINAEKPFEFPRMSHSVLESDNTTTFILIGVTIALTLLLPGLGKLFRGIKKL